MLQDRIERLLYDFESKSDCGCADDDVSRCAHADEANNITSDDSFSENCIKEAINLSFKR